jgi:hypothetical protein
MAHNMDLIYLLTVEHCPVNSMHRFILNRINKVDLKYYLGEVIVLISIPVPCFKITNALCTNI